MPFLVISKIFYLFDNILSTDHKDSLCRRENLEQSIQMQLSRKQKIVFEFFALFLKCTSNFEHLERKMTLIAYVFPKLQTVKDVVM